MNRSRRVAIVLLLIVGIFVNPRYALCYNNFASSESQLEYSIIAGEWQRTDGNYLIKINKVLADGQTTALYFNPRPIHVAHSNISRQDKLIKLFIQFQDTGYEGSTYTLYYYPEKDALVGFYYQAAMDRTYEVIFLRKSN